MKMLTLSLLLCAVMVLTRAEATDTNTDSVMTDLVKRTSTCPSGWKTFGDHCFCFVSHEMTWARAEKNCQTMGGNLASVLNANQQKIQEMILKVCNKSQQAWLGGSDSQEVGWVISDPSQYDSDERFMNNKSFISC